MNSKQIDHRNKEFERMRTVIRMHGKALTTERSYLRWLGKYIGFVCGRTWKDGVTSKEKVEAFLGAEANRGVASSTQNSEGGTLSPNPYAMPVCGKCCEEYFSQANEQLPHP